MDRRNALAGLAGITSGALLTAGTAQSAEPKSTIPGAIELTLGQKLKIGVQSAAVKVNETDLHLVSIGTGTFQLDEDSRLTAILKAAVAQYAKVDYWISVAVFDAAGKLLGTAGHKEPVEYIRLGKMPTLLRDIKLDFGISKTFKDAAAVVVAISDRDVPAP